LGKEVIENIPIRIFELIVQGDRLSNSENELLVSDLRKNCFYSCALGINTSDLKLITEIIEQRSHLLQLVYPEILQTLALHNIQLDPPSVIFPLLWHYWLPLAQSLANQQEKIGRTFIQGLLGGQGTGKTTLGIVLNILLRHLGKTFLSISLDDLYKTYSDRQKLRDRRPDLIWRGPPSTHDIDLGIQVLQQLRDRQPNRSQPIAIPRFDKSLHNGAGDRIEPEISYSADIILFEGWFVGMRPIPISEFQNFVPPILSEGDLKFAIECNANLYDYLPLWKYLDSLMVLVPEDYRYSLQWRIEAEHKLIALGKTGMSDREITEFVEYFWKALHPQLFMPPVIDRHSAKSCADLVVEISRSHVPTRIYSPARTYAKK
jgi:D-glycerate 3-kinase